MPTIAQMLPKGTSVKLGSSGLLVQMIQTVLAGRGYPLRGTGYFGPATDTAVMAFQKRRGLAPDGEVGPITAAALDAADKTPRAGVPKDVAAEIARPLWLEAGMQLIGTKETAGAGDTKVIMDWAKDEGGDIAEVYTHDVIPWCALFANHCLTKAGFKGTETLLALHFAGKWPSIRLPGIAVGAFAPMVRDGGGHIGIVVGKDQFGNVMLLGGNQSDAVNIKPFAVSRLNKGFWWPASAAPPAKTGFASLPVVSSSGRVSSNEA